VPAVRKVFWRILLFYVFAILIIGLLIPYTDPQLLKNDVGDIASAPSPWCSNAPACWVPRP
jgi:lysine-specific permease